MTRRDNWCLRTASLLTISLMVIGSAWSVRADTITESASADSFVFDGSYANDNFGADAQLSAGYVSGFNAITYIKFPVNLDPGFSIESATLRLYCIPSQSGSFKVQRASGSWSEGSITWNNQPGYLSTPWTFIALDATDVWAEWDVTSIVEKWHVDGDPNNGFIVWSGAIGSGGYFNFASSENGTSSRHPELVIIGSTAPPDPSMTATFTPQTFNLEEDESDTKNNIWTVGNNGDDGSSCTYSFTKSAGSGWLTISPDSGTLTRSGAPIYNEIDVSADATGYSSGSYTSTVTLVSSDPDFPDVQREVIMNVSPPPGPDWAFSGSQLLDLGPYEPGQLIPFEITVTNKGNLAAPASRVLLESYDYYTTNDYRELFVDVPGISVGGSYTTNVGIWCGPNTTHIYINREVNADGLTEQDYANNSGWTFNTVSECKPSRLFGDVSEKTGFSGDPVNTAIGNFVHHSTDMAIPARIDAFEFTRFYNSLSTNVSAMGRGWRHTFMYSMDLTTANRPGVIYPDGHSEYWNDIGGSYVPLFPQIFNKLEADGGGWKLTMKDLTTVNFDSTGRCTGYADKNGNTVTFGYTGDNLTTVIDPTGRTLTLTYSGPKLTKVQDWTGRHVDFSYTGDNLTGVTDTRTNSIALRYDGGNRLDRITDQRGNHVMTVVYDSLGRAIQQTDANTNVMSFAYDSPAAFSTTITNADGTSSVHVHNESYQLVEVIDELGRSVSYTYDDTTGLRSSITDKRTNTTSWAYDSRGNLLQTDYPDGTSEIYVYNSLDLPVTHTDPATNVTSWAYDANGNVLAETNALGQSRSFTYNGFGQKTLEVDRSGASRTFTYDGQGRLTRVEDADGIGETYGYDALWRRTTVTDDRANTTTTVYNPDDSIAEVQRPIGTVQYSYDAAGNLIQETDANGNTTTYEYDGNNNRTRVILPGGLGSTEYEYDSMNRLAVKTDGRGNAWTNVYYADGRLHKELDPLGNEHVYSYDPAGNVVSEIDASGRTNSYTYDAMNRRLSSVDGEGHTTTFEYDSRGLKVRQTDKRGNDTLYGYDALRRMTSVTIKASSPAQDATTAYTYDEEDRLLTMTDAEASAWNNLYSPAGRRTNRVDALGRVTAFSYDSAGNLSRIDHPTGEWETYTYDDNNRRTGLSYSDGRTAAYMLDAHGNTTQSVDWVGTTVFSYDAAHRLTSVTDPHGKTVSYGYDLSGNRTTIQYPGLGAVTYGYDERNALERVTDWNAAQFNYMRDGAQRLTARTFPNGVSASYAYDDAGRLTQMSYQKDAATLASYSLGLDANGNPTTVNATGLPSADAVYSNSLTYTHDAAHQMTSSGETDYTYDQRGAMSWREQPGELESTFNFTADGMLQSYSSLDGTAVSNRFDAAKQRLSATRDGIETRYILDRQRGMANVLVETSSAGTTQRAFVHGEETLAMYSDAGVLTHCYLSDPFGNVIALTDASGAVTDSYRYDPFGNVIGETGTTDNPFKFVGAYGVMQEPAGLYFMRARFYDPEQGRFISVDPVEGETINPATMHRYLYSQNNSLVYADPNGEFFGALTLGSAAIGGSANAIMYGLTHSWEGDGGFWQFERNMLGAFAEGAIAGGAVGLAIETGGLAGHAAGVVAGLGVNTAFWADDALADGEVSVTEMGSLAISSISIGSAPSLVHSVGGGLSAVGSSLVTDGTLRTAAWIEEGVDSWTQEAPRTPNAVQSAGSVRSGSVPNTRDMPQYQGSVRNAVQPPATRIRQYETNVKR